MYVLYNNSAIDFMIRVFEKYNGKNTYLYFYIFLFALVLILLWGGRYYSSVFVYPAVVFFVVMFNPISLKVLDNQKLIPSGRFYRFIWVLPIVIGVAFVLTFIIYKINNKAVRNIAIVLGCLAVIFGGNPSRAIEIFSPAENTYKIPQYIVDVSESIHNDFGDGVPTVYYGDDFVYLYRTYDPAVISYRGREETLPIKTDEEAKAIVEDGIERPILELVILQNKKNLISDDKLIKYLSKIDYVICNNNEDNEAFYSRIGLKRTSVINGYEIYRNTNRV